MGKTWKKWELWEYDYLKNNYQKTSTKIMSEYLIRSEKSIMAQLHRMRLLKIVHYNNKEKEYVKENYGKIPTILIANKLKKSIQSVRNEANRLKVAVGIRVNPNKRTEKSLAIDKYITENYSSKKAKEIARFLGISTRNVKIRAFRLGLRKYNV